jgi:hypothetical protein
MLPAEPSAATGTNTPVQALVVFGAVKVAEKTPLEVTVIDVDA